ncbi:probable disease resistance protein At5g63020 [Fagus crenata]
MDLVGPILTIASCLWNCTTKQAKYICDLKENLELLRNGSAELNNQSQGVRRRVRCEEITQHMKRTERVNGWLQTVEDLEREVEVILQNGDQELQKKCLLSCCPRNCRSRHRLGKAVSRKIIEVSDAIKKGDFDDVAYQLPQTAIMELPSELKKLRKLKCLLLDYTKKLKEISTKGISSLSCLQVFSMVTDEFSPFITTLYDEQALLEELERLNLGDLRITILSTSGAIKVSESPMLQKCLKMLSIKHCCDLRCLQLSSSSLGRMNRLVKLEITFCKGLQEVEIINDTRLIRNPCFQSLHEVVIWMCDLLSHATWLIYAPCLQKLTIADCSKMATVATYTQIEDDEIFSSLQTLHLQNLPSLKSICPGSLRFPALTEIHVDQCKSLKELPLNAGSASRLKQIKGTASWWNRLQWDDNAIEEAFRSKFIEIPNNDDDNE